MPEASDEAHRIRAYYRDASWAVSPGRHFLVAEWREQIEAMVANLGIGAVSLRVCDVGCGTGSDLQRWNQLGVPQGQLSGTELIADRAKAARRILPEASVEFVSGFDVPFADAAFDLVTASLVFSTVLDPAGRRSLAAEMRRVVAPGGLIAIYDFRIRKPWNPHVRAVADRDLTAVLGDPWMRVAVSPFLPLLDLALRLPRPMTRAVLRLLPRTHRIWVWRS